MSHRSQHDSDVIAAQEAMLRLAERDYALTSKRLELETGIPIVTLRSYRRDTMMPLSAFVKLARVIPDELTSLCLDLADKRVAPNEEPEGDLDELECEASGIVHEIAKAKRDKIVTPQERAKIADMTRHMLPCARAVAA